MSNYGKRTDFPVKQIAKDTYLIDDFGVANMYLIVGSEKALLIDCGTGLGDLVGAIRKITDKPIIVVGTHGHVDHMGGDGLFDKVFVHKDDTGRIYRFMTSPLVRHCLLLGAVTKDKTIKQKDIRRYKTRPEVVPIEDGYIFDLGNKQIKVVHSKGHTRGSIILLDDETKIAFVGDNICPSPWLFLPNTTSVEEWLPEAKKILELTKEYTPWWGHEGGKLTPELIENVIKIGEEVLSKYPKNRKFMTVKFYPFNDRVNGSVVFRTTNVWKK